jgi:hypothetical protein
MMQKPERVRVPDQVPGALYGTDNVLYPSDKTGDVL